MRKSKPNTGSRLSSSVRRQLTAVLVLLPLLWMVLAQAHPETEDAPEAPRPAMEAVLSGFESQTGARNAVASVYLNYRLFDTLLETLLLAVSVTGIVYFLEEKGHEDTERPS